MKKNILLTILILVINMLPGGAVGTNAGERDSKGTTILEDGVYFNGKVFIPFKEIIIKDGKIDAILQKASKTKGTRIPLHGKYVIPGLTDAHVHISSSPTYPPTGADERYNINSNLMCGVTTDIDLFYIESGFKAIKEEAAKEPEYYSSLIMSGPILTAPGGHGTEYHVPTRTITSIAEATKSTNEVIDAGVDVIKLVYEADTSNYIPSITKDMVKAIVDAAHARHIKVFAHIDRAAQAVDCAEVGVDILAHMPCDGLTGEQLSKLKSSGIIIIPTISVYQSVFEGHDAKYMSDTLLWKTSNPDYLEKFTHKALPKPPMPEARLLKYFVEKKYYANLRSCIKAGIPILAGTDAGNYAVFYGYSLHNEMLQYVLAGMSNADALCTATQNISLVFPNIKTGKIAEGFDADLVVLDADPLKDIENTKKINMVFHKGMLAKSITEKPKPKPINYNPAVFDISKLEKLPPYISTYTDSAIGGSSVITAQLLKDQQGKSYLQLTGKTVKKSFTEFAGIYFGLSGKEEDLPADISAYKAIAFDVKGNGESYMLEIMSSLVKDYNYHFVMFKTTADWQTITISFSDLKQNPFYGKKMLLDLATISGVSFQAANSAYDINFGLRNIHLVK